MPENCSGGSRCYRSACEIILELLTLAETGISRTSLMNRSNLNAHTFNSYVEMLLDMRALEAIKKGGRKGKARIIYKTTSRGMLLRDALLIYKALKKSGENTGAHALLEALLLKILEEGGIKWSNENTLMDVAAEIQGVKIEFLIVPDCDNECLESISKLVAGKLPGIGKRSIAVIVTNKGGVSDYMIAQLRDGIYSLTLPLTADSEEIRVDPKQITVHLKRISQVHES